MIWGKTRWQRKMDRDAEHVWFAWYPVRLTDGRWAWLESLRRRWWEDRSANYAGDSSHWRYKL